MIRITILLLVFSISVISCNGGKENDLQNEETLIREIATSATFKSMMEITFSSKSEMISNPTEIAANKQQRENEKRMFDAYGEILTQHKDELAKSRDELSYTTTFRNIILASNYDDTTKQYLIKRIGLISSTLQQKTDIMDQLVKEYPMLKDRAFQEKVFKYYRNAQKL